MSDLFSVGSKEQSAQDLSNHMPKGRAWALKNDRTSNLRKLIRSLAASYNAAKEKISELHDELDARQTLGLLREWEMSVGIPDECLGESETLIQRRQVVIDRLRKQPVVTLEEMENYVNTLFPELNITLIPGSEYFTFEYDFEVPFLGDVNEKFILVVRVPVGGESFEYDFEVPFVGGPDTERLRCLLEKIVPANVYVIIEFTGDL